MARTRSETSRLNPRTVAFVVLGLALLGGGSVFIGSRDAGVIDVTATISNSVREQQVADPTIQTPQPLSEELKNLPNGGLVPTENTEVAPEVETTAQGATTTPEDAATSTTDGGEEVQGEDTQGSRE